MKQWIANLWAGYYLRKYLTGNLTTYGLKYSIGDILYEARTNPLCPRGTVGILEHYFITTTRREILQQTQVDALRQYGTRKWNNGATYP